jgi:hypothetical protein
VSFPSNAARVGWPYKLKSWSRIDITLMSACHPWMVGSFDTLKVLFMHALTAVKHARLMSIIDM